MTKQEIVAYVVAILETVKECKGAPSGHIYAVLMSRMNLEEYNAIIDLMKSSGFIEVNRHFITLTAKGSELLTGV